LLAACSGPPETPVLVQRQVPVELVRPCPRQPDVPTLADDRDLFVWLSQALQAGAECRDQSDAQSKWIVSGQPSGQPSGQSSGQSSGQP
jgi:hypothetical protein